MLNSKMAVKSCWDETRVAFNIKNSPDSVRGNQWILVYIFNFKNKFYVYL